MPSDEPRLSPDPIRQFKLWFRDAQKHMPMPEALCLSTVNPQGRPSARMVLLKDVGPQGFSFFTNINSPKAKDLLARPYAAITFYWAPIKRQVRIEGKAVVLPKKAAEEYFATRARLSQMGSWASEQSRPLTSRSVLERRMLELTASYEEKQIPAPAHWRGFRVIPSRVEFWQERPNRLHDRWNYLKKAGRWVITRLYP